jgi:hypothetical protein
VSEPLLSPVNYFFLGIVPYYRPTLAFLSPTQRVPTFSTASTKEHKSYFILTCFLGCPRRRSTILKWLGANAIAPSLYLSFLWHALRKGYDGWIMAGRDS